MNVVNYHTGEGTRTALVVNRARKLMTVVYIEGHGVVARKVPLTEERYMTPVEYKGKDYPVTRAKRMFKRAGRNLGITKTAKRALA